jgi:hypothetical protein
MGSQNLLISVHLRRHPAPATRNLGIKRAASIAAS